MKVKDFMSVMNRADDTSVVVLEHGKDLFDITDDGCLHQAENRYGWVAENFPQYADGEIESVSVENGTFIFHLAA